MQLSLVDIQKTLQNSVNKSRHIQTYAIPYTDNKQNLVSQVQKIQLAWQTEQLQSPNEKKDMQNGISKKRT